jgi:AcrR family transcriptional regulator
MARRGEELRKHILLTAKDVFLEMGFERASMDVLAARAETSKRTLYAHFESKDKLFLAVVDLVRELYLDKLKTPAHYGSDPAQAVTLFCGRFLQMLVWGPSLRTCRLGIAEADRLPEAAGRYYEAIFDTAEERLATFLGDRYGLPAPDARSTARDLLGRTLYPRFMRALFGVDELRDDWPEESSIAADIDLAPIRGSVSTLLPAAPAAPGGRR